MSEPEWSPEANAAFDNLVEQGRIADEGARREIERIKRLREPVEVQIVWVAPMTYSGEGNKRFRNYIGEITGISGQYVQVKITKDPEGNAVEFSFGQPLGPGADVK